MALTHNGTRIDVPASELPSGYTKPSVTDFDDHETVYASREFTVAKSTVENATATTTMTNLVSAINTAIEALINADFDTTGLTVTSYAVMRSLVTNDTLVGVKFTNGTVNYVMTIDVYVKTA